VRDGERGPRNRQRERVLRFVRERGGAVDASELAERTGLHVTTVRFHLDALCDDGAISRTRIARSGVGRPRTGYVAVQDRMDYQSLAEILALELGDTAQTRRRRAERAGRRWAARIAANSPHEAGESVDRPEAMVVDVFHQMGFAPEVTRGRQRVIRLRACAVRDLARAHPEVGCALHLGLLRGLAGAGAHAELEPFVEPELCIAKVITHD
jgi:predicted ArsR family transcriptional regulator